MIGLLRANKVLHKFNLLDYAYWLVQHFKRSFISQRWLKNRWFEIEAGWSV